MIIDTLLVFWLIGSLVLLIVSLFISDGNIKRLWWTLTRNHSDSFDYMPSDKAIDRISIALYYFDSKMGPSKLIEYPSDLSRPIAQAISRLFDATYSPEQNFMVVLLPSNCLLCNSYFSYHDRMVRGEQRLFMLSFIVEATKKQEFATLSDSSALQRMIMGWIHELKQVENLSQMITDGNLQVSPEMNLVRSKLQIFRQSFSQYITRVQN